MPTMEERVAKMERDFTQFKADTIGAYQEMAMQVTIIKGLAETTIGRLAMMQGRIDLRFNLIETALNEHKAILFEQKAAIAEHTVRLDRVEGVLAEHTSVLNGHTARLDRVEGVLEEHTSLLNGHTALLNEHTTRFDRVESLLGEILTRLPEKA